jgi:hypothetical protein
MVKKFMKVDVFSPESEEEFLLSGVAFRFVLVLDNAISFFLSIIFCDIQCEASIVC